MSWPITSVHIDSEIEVWTEEVSCGDESTCYEDFFRANLILNCALLNDGNYTCGPEVENGTLIQTNLAVNQIIVSSPVEGINTASVDLCRIPVLHL